MPTCEARYHPRPVIFMQPADQPANDPCKINPYHQSTNKCLRDNKCPFRDKPVQMHSGDFKQGELVSIDDRFCSRCQSKIERCPAPPPPPPPPPPPWQRWALLAGLVVLLLGAGIWALLNRPSETETAPVVPHCADGTVQGDTCIENTKYELVCDGHGGYRKGNQIGACGEPVQPSPGPTPRTYRPPVIPPDGPVVKKDPRDGKCKEFMYRNGEIVGQRILPPEECNTRR